MSKKTLAYISAGMIVIFLATVIVYPMIFSPEPTVPDSTPMNPPVVAPIAPGN